MTMTQEREAFKAYFKHLDLSEEKDAWGRPCFAFTHVDSLWHGWLARAGTDVKTLAA